MSMPSDPSCPPSAAPVLSAADRGRLAAALEAAQAAGAILRHHFRRADLDVERKADASPVTVADREAERAIRRVLGDHDPSIGVLGEEFGAAGGEARRWVVDPLDGTKNFVAGLPYFATLIGLEEDGRRTLGVIHAPALPDDRYGDADPARRGRTWWAVRGAGAWSGAAVDVDGPWRRIRAASVERLDQAFLGYGGLVHVQRAGLWSAFSTLLPRLGRTRGFGDWWGHVLVAEGHCHAMLEGAVAFHDVAAVEVVVEEAGAVMARWRDAPLAPGMGDPLLTAVPALMPDLKDALGW
ncbi:MAG: inositol monophosphatase family protein [Acidobacteriota bacterium]